MSHLLPAQLHSDASTRSMNVFVFRVKAGITLKNVWLDSSKNWRVQIMIEMGLLMKLSWIYYLGWSFSTITVKTAVVVLVKSSNASSINWYWSLITSFIIVTLNCAAWESHSKSACELKLIWFQNLTTYFKCSYLK